MKEQEFIETDESIDLSAYINVLIERKLLILTCLIITVFIVMFRTFLMTPIYSASSVLVIDRENRKSPVTGGELDFGSYQDQVLTFNTHFELIKSKPIIEEVIRELKLDSGAVKIDTNTHSFKGILRKYKENLQLLLKKDSTEKSEEDATGRMVASIQNTIKIKPTKDTRLLTISVENTNPELASNIANVLGSKYIEFDVASRLKATKKNMSFMNQEMYALKKQLEDDEQAFLEFKKNQNVFSLEGKQKIIDQKINEFNNEYLSTRNKRLELDAKLKEVEKQMGSTSDIFHTRSILSNSMIDDLYSKLTNLEMEANKIGKVFKSQHPQVLQINSEIEKAKVKLQTELKKEVDNLKSERSVLFAKEQTMENNIGAFEQDALDAGSKEMRYTILQRNLNTSQALYDTVLARMQESQINTGSPTSNIRIVEPASVPRSPIKPNKTRNLLLSVVLGLFGGVGLAFGMEYLDRSVRSEEDVEMYLELPLLAVIPKADENDRHGNYA